MSKIFEVRSSTEKDENLENRPIESCDSNHSDESSIENMEKPIEQAIVQENLQPIEPNLPEEPNRSVIGSLENIIEVLPSSQSGQQPSTSDASLERENDNEPATKSTTSDASTETKYLGKASDKNEPASKSTTSDLSTETVSSVRSHTHVPAVKSTSDVSTETASLQKASDKNEPTAKSTTSDVSTGTESLASDKSEPVAKLSPSKEMSASRAPSDQGLQEVSDNIQQIYEGLKDMKISSEELPVSASGKKARKLLTTPRARSTPVKPLSSPPLTRSRSRDLRKFPSTPSSPRSSASRKNSTGDTDDIKDIRGRQRVKKI